MYAAEAHTERDSGLATVRIDRGERVRVSAVSIPIEANIKRNE